MALLGKAVAGHWHVAGPGAVGCLWAARLKHLNRNRVFIIDKCRDINPKSIQISIKKGYQNSSTRNKDIKHLTETVPLELSTISTPIQNLLVCTKASDVVTSLSNLKHRLSRSTRVVLICNGVLGAYEEVKQSGMDYKFILGSNTHGSYINDRSHDSVCLVHAGFGSLSLGIPKDCEQLTTQSDLRQVVESLGTTGLQVEENSKVEEALWKKLGVNACINAFSALLECKNGSIIEFDDGKLICQQVLKEMARVAEFDGISLNESELYDYVVQVATKTKDNYSSTYQDIIKKKRKSEISYLNGFIVAQAQARGIGVPYNKLLNDLVLIKEQMQLL